MLHDTHGFIILILAEGTATSRTIIVPIEIMGKHARPTRLCQRPLTQWDLYAGRSRRCD